MIHLAISVLFLSGAAVGYGIAEGWGLLAIVPLLCAGAARTAILIGGEG
jgi:hypothetical protein